MLDEAVEQSIPAASVRVGQTAGPQGIKGGWNRQEFIPRLIASSMHLKMLPDNLGAQQVVSWTPVEAAAGLVLDIAGVTAPVAVSEISGSYHGVNQTTTDWSELAYAAFRGASSGLLVSSIGLPRWRPTGADVYFQKATQASSSSH